MPLLLRTRARHLSRSARKLLHPASSHGASARIPVLFRAPQPARARTALRRHPHTGIPISIGARFSSINPIRPGPGHAANGQRSLFAGPTRIDSFSKCRIRHFVDNGQVYVSRHLIAILVELHIKHIRHPPYQAYCKGKIEAANKIIKNQFQREAQVAGIRTLDELNSAFWAWMDLDYNTRVLAATGQSPDARFGDGLPPDQRRITDLDAFNALFLWRQRRTVSKYGRIKLHGNQYPVTSVPYGTVVEVRFDPYDLAQLAIYDASGVLIETTSAAKQVTAQVPNIPAESAAKPAQVSAAARVWFTRLREQHHAALRDHNQTSFTRFQSTDDDNKELRDADA